MYWDDKYGTHSVSYEVSKKEIKQVWYIFLPQILFSHERQEYLLSGDCLHEETHGRRIKEVIRKLISAR